MTTEQESGRLRFCLYWWLQRRSVLGDVEAVVKLLVASEAAASRGVVGVLSRSRQLPSAGGFILETDGGKPGLYKVPVQSAPLAGACAEAALRVLRDYGAELGDFRAVGLAEAEAGRMNIA